MRISDWSSDVCSSDLRERIRHRCEHPHVIARRAVDSLRDPRQPAEDVAAANDEAEFVPRLFRRGDLTRDARHRLGIDPEGRFAHQDRSEEHTSELQSLMRTSYAVLCLKKKNNT